MNTQALIPYVGDPVVWTTAVGSANRIRKLTAADIAALYLQGGDTCGILGLCPSTVATDAAGGLTAPLSPNAVQSNVQPIYQVPSMQGYAPKNPTNGALMSSVISCQNFLGGGLWQNTAITEALIGTMVGLKISTISGSAPTFYWDTAATTKIARIVGVEVDNQLFGTAGTANVADTSHYPRCPVYVRVLAAYNQFSNAFSYST